MDLPHHQNTRPKNNPQEKVVNIRGIRSWFTRADYPRAMTVSIGTGAPEPDPMPAKPPPGPSSGKINASGLEIVKHFEGLRNQSYQDSVGVWTIGYGHTSMAGPPTVGPGMTISTAEAETILKRDLGVFEKAVSDAVTRTPTDDQFSGNGRPSPLTWARGLFAVLLCSKSTTAATFPELPTSSCGGCTRVANIIARPTTPGVKRPERALYLSQDYRQFIT